MVGSRRFDDRAAIIALLVVAVGVTATGFGNGFAYDDVGLLVNDPRLHSWHTLPSRLTDPWWPTGLYRPVSLAWLATQWILFSGHPLVFRIVSSLLYGAVTGVLYLLCRRAGLPLGPSLAGAMLFAIHPVHSEVTANTVGQAELLTALTAVWTVVLYLELRKSPAAGWPGWLGIAALVLLSANAKESGYVVPGVLIAAECLLVSDARPWRERLMALRPPGLLLIMTISASLLVRDQVLGSLGGETPHRALVGLSVGERITGMLLVVPEWVRLLLWPARLQAEYGPPGLDVGIAFGARHLLGIVLLGIVIGTAVVFGRRATVLAFGVVWLGLALAPVANLLFPTGILLAERTLFLPSVGFCVAFAGAVQAAQAWWQPRRGPRYAMVGGFVVAAATGAIHSAARQPAWRDTLTILEITAEDAGSSYRAQMTYARELVHVGRPIEAEPFFRRAILLWDRDPRPFEDLGQLLRVRGDCTSAIPVLRGGVLADSSADVARSRLIECLITERRWDEADAEITRGLAQGVAAYRDAANRVRLGRAADRMN